jgi:uncharacterized protein (DUF1015 family)
MPDVKPFRGVRFTASDDLARLVCPPYDVISPADQVRLLELHPNNAVRLELPKGETDDRYEAAHQTFRDWLEAGVLATDETPSFYVYRQDFIKLDGSRAHVTGIIGALKLEPFGEGVLPHERTMPGPKKDRLALLKALPVNVSPIYTIYRGAGGLAPFLESLENRPTTARFKDGAGTLHRLWVVSAPAEIEMLSDALGKQPLVIADGHHRYETALEFDPTDSVMTFAVDADSEDLVVLPYHRAIRASTGAENVRKTLESRFAARTIEEGSFEDAIASSASDHPLAFVFEDDSVLAEVGDAQVVEAVGGRSSAWRALDVVALHEVVLPELFPAGADELSFSRDHKDIIRLVREEAWTTGVLLRALTAPMVVDVAQSGERMPQKASYFWPKAITGLVFRPLDRTR